MSRPSYSTARAPTIGPGSDCLSILDHRSGALRTPLLGDVGDAVRLADGLPDIDFVMSMFLPADVDQRSADRHQMRLMLTESDKPVVFVTYDTSGCRDAVAMAEVLAGGSDALRQQAVDLLLRQRRDCVAAEPRGS